MTPASFYLDTPSLDVLKREVGERYRLGNVSNVDNLSSTLEKGDYSHVIFYGSEKDLTTRVLVETVGNRWEVRIFPTSID